MLPPNEQFQILLKMAMTGSESAAQQLFENYEAVLLHAIRRKLNKKVRSKFDSVDIAQDVWASFFAQPAEKRVFEKPENLLAFLTTLANNKVVDAMRQRLTIQKYNVNREQSLDDSQLMQKDDLVSPQFTPSHIMMTREEWSEFLRRQPPVYRRMFILLRDGHTYEQIAAELSIHVRTIARIVAKAMAESPK